jgi:hypothetical protein
MVLLAGGSLMSKESWGDLTDKQQKILRTAKTFPDRTNEEIAKMTDSSASYVSQVRNDYEDQVEIKKGSNSALMFLIVLVLIGLWMAVESGML